MSTIVMFLFDTFEIDTKVHSSFINEYISWLYFLERPNNPLKCII